MDVRVLVRRRGLEIESDRIGTLPLRDREYLAEDQFFAEYGADPDDVEFVRQFAAAHALEVTASSELMRTVDLSGSPDSFAQALGVEFSRARIGGQSYVYPKTPLVVPQALNRV